VEKQIPLDREALLRVENLKKVRRAWELAKAGNFECQGGCKRVVRMADGLVVMARGNVLWGICFECFPGQAVAMAEVDRSYGKGVWVGNLRDLERRTGIGFTPNSNLVTGDRAMSAMNQLQAVGALAAQRRVKMGEED